MAIERVINIVANAKQAVGEIKTLFKELLDAEIQQQKLNKEAEQMGDAYKEGAKDAEKSLNKVEKSVESQSKAMKGLKSVIGSVGTAFKAIGIGAVIALVAKFTQVLSENQKVMDFVNDVSTTLSIVINQLFDSFTKIFTKINEATGGFDALGKVVGGVVTILFNNLKLTVIALETAFQGLKLAYENVFGDDEGVKKAEARLKELTKKTTETLKDNFEQGKKVFNNIGEAVGEVVNGVSILATEGTKAISEVDLKGAYAQAKAINQSRKNFELLALQQERLQLQYQYQAEALRQLRDDDTKAISDRIKANDRLSSVLEKQLQAESKTINQRISGLQQEQKLLGVTVERSNQIYQLQTDLVDVAERLKGAQSEQLQNRNALLREERDLLQSIKDSETERILSQKEFEKERLFGEEAKLQKQREILEAENQIILEDLERKREIYALGTQARTDAEQEYLTKKQEIDNNLKQNETDLFRFYEQQYAEDLAKRKALEDQKISLTEDTFGKIAAILGENSRIGKIAASAQALINTYQGVTEIWANKTTLPEPFGTINKIASTALAVKAGFDAVKNINKVKTLSGGGGGASPSEISTPSAPSFNLVTRTGTNQIAESLATEKQPVKAYVVASEVSTQQAMDRNAQSNAGL